METKKNNHSINAFFWGFALGALFASLLTTKRGRRILRELSELGLEMVENFVEERVGREESVSAPPPPPPKAPKTPTSKKEAEEDIESEIAEEEVPEEVSEETESEKEEETKEENSASEKTEESNGNSGKKKRLFRGIRKK